MQKDNVSKIPVEVVDAEKAKLAKLEGQIKTMEGHMKELRAL